MRQARAVEGRFRSWRSRANVALIVVLLGLPWLQWRGFPLVLLDVPERRFHVFGLVIHPQEMFFLWLVITLAAASLFLFTALLGRVWCGWACPQTVFTDLFAGLERRIAPVVRGKPAARWRRGVVQALWLGIAGVVAFHVVAWFVPARELAGRLFLGADPGWSVAGFAWIALTAITLFDFALFRQRFCKFLCPYARFQSVLFDRDTLVIGYDASRGEPRGKRGTTTGDCVDCSLCVQVCPSDIDIRDGMQLECIACTQCIDACDGVMAQLDRPRGLIDYRSLRGLEGGGSARLLRPRPLIYGTILTILGATFALHLAAREPVGFSVTHRRGTIAARMGDGRIGNAFDVRIENRGHDERRYALSLEDAPSGVELVAGVNPVSVAGLDAVDARVFVVASNEAAGSLDELSFVLEPVDGAHAALRRMSHFLHTGGTPHVE